jgi:hypothetical protein
VPVALFVALDLALLLAIGPGGVAGLTFAGLVPVTLAAAAGTAALAWATGLRSPWRLAVAFGVYQSVGLWATALPGVL